MLRKSSVQNFRFKVADKISDFPDKVDKFHNKIPAWIPREVTGTAGVISLLALLLPFTVILLLFCLVFDTLYALAKDG